MLARRVSLGLVIRLSVVFVLSARYDARVGVRLTAVVNEARHAANTGGINYLFFVQPIRGIRLTKHPQLRSVQSISKGKAST